MYHATVSTFPGTPRNVSFAAHATAQEVLGLAGFTTIDTETFLYSMDGSIIDDFAVAVHDNAQLVINRCIEGG